MKPEDVARFFDLLIANPFQATLIAIGVFAFAFLTSFVQELGKKGAGAISREGLADVLVFLQKWRWIAMILALILFVALAWTFLPQPCDPFLELTGACP
ncbi:MAG TPA: hypothetical protein PKE65_06975 [Rhizobiaceae bacterium]|nr:hypothetical protein [Rhizobiaceae bacterium]